jgi:hypothetical protein
MKKVLVGCGVVLLLLAAVVAVVMLAWPKITKRVNGFVQQQKDEAAKQEAFESAWTPPAPQPDEAWFPTEVAGWKRESVAAIHDVPELKLTRDGYLGVYAQDGRHLELSVVPVTELELEALLGRAHAITPRPENRGAISTTQWANKLEIKYGDRERVYCRPLQKWFLFLHSYDGGDVKAFTDAWMHAVDQTTSAGKSEGGR